MESEWDEQLLGTDLFGKNNSGGDVLCENCLSAYNQIACARDALVAVLALILGVWGFLRIVFLHGQRVVSPVQLLLHYILIVHCIVGSLEWVFGWTTQISLFVSYVKGIELLVVCHFYIDLAAKMMHWTTRSVRGFAVGSLFLLFVYFTLFVFLGFFLAIEPSRDCHSAYWMCFSVAQLLTAQVMVTSCLMILHRMPSTGQSGQFILLSFVFELSALSDLAYHLMLFTMADSAKGCSAIFKHDQLRYSMVKLPYDMVSFLLPVITILHVFRRSSTRDLELEEDELTRYTDVVAVRNWQRRYRPLNSSRYEEHLEASRNRKRDADHRRMRRVSSAPSMVPPTRRPSVSRSLFSSPLYSIPEEQVHHSSSSLDSFDSN